MPRADLHAHSCFSYDVPNLTSLSPRVLFETALGNPDPQFRMDYFCLTDHDTMAGYEDLVGQLPEADRDLVIPAVEHTLRDPHIGFTIHVNLYFIDPDTYARLLGQVTTLDDLLVFCDEHGVMYQYNHPTWWEEDEYRAGMVDFAQVPEIAQRFPVLELNAGRTASANLITMRLAREMGKALTSNSDSHSGHIGSAHNLAPGRTAHEFVRNIWAGRGDTSTSVLTYEGLLGIVHSLIDGVMDQEKVHLDRQAVNAGMPHLQMVLAWVLNSQLLRRHPLVRNSVKVMLKQVSPPLIRRKFGFEKDLERGLAESSLGAYLQT
jgi:predicted metal-dependent phosphoesterase TrpH